MQPVLKDKVLQSKLDHDGFVVINLLSQDQISALKDVFQQHILQPLSEFSSTNMMGKPEWRRTVGNNIMRVIGAKVEEALCNTVQWLPAFLIKPIGDDTEFPAHQDWTFVDETKFMSGNVWIPLKDVDVADGTLHFVKRSHHLMTQSVRVHSLPYFFDGNQEYVKRFCEPVPVRAGQAIVFYHRTIHYSPSNVGDSNRVAVSCGFHSMGAPLMFYRMAGDDVIEEYIMPNDYVFDFEGREQLRDRPRSGVLNRTFQHLNRVLSLEELERLFG